jgi:hypothetical protein
MDFKQELINYARKEIDPIKHPSRGKSEIEIKNIELLTNILVSFLEYEVTDPSLARIESNFKSAFKNINDLNKSTLASALEQLATNFESFIKKIAYLKFYNDFPDLWTGTSVYKGINKSTLGDLLMSVVSVKDSENERKSLQYPSLLVDFKGIRQAVYDKARQIRNSVHEAREYLTIELIASINLLLGVYFLAIEDNKVFLASKLLPEYLLLSKKLENEEYSTLDKLYIEQLGIKNKELELTASKVSFYTDILPEFDQEDELEGTGSED